MGKKKAKKAQVCDAVKARRSKKPSALLRNFNRQAGQQNFKKFVVTRKDASAIGALGLEFKLFKAGDEKKPNASKIIEGILGFDPENYFIGGRSVKLSKAIETMNGSKMKLADIVHVLEGHGL